MTMTTGTKLGSYEILAPLEKGGMGVVYRANDTRLNCDVVICYKHCAPTERKCVTCAITSEKL